MTAILSWLTCVTCGAPAEVPSPKATGTYAVVVSQVAHADPNWRRVVGALGGENGLQGTMRVDKGLYHRFGLYRDK